MGSFAGLILLMMFEGNFFICLLVFGDFVASCSIFIDDS